MGRRAALRVPPDPGDAVGRAPGDHGDVRRQAPRRGRRGVLPRDPYSFTRWAIRQVNAGEGRPAIFYFHPWEIDPGQARVAGAPLKSRLRHYANLDKMAGKLRQLVREFAWGRMDLLAHREAARLEYARAD